MEKSIKYAVCEAPICVGSPTVGTEEAYSHLKANGLLELLSDCSEFTDFTSSRTEKEILKDPRLKNLETVVGVNKALLETQRTVYKKGRFPINVGGDHSIVMSSISALSEISGAENTAVIYIDGHADINTETTSLSGRIHGMPLAETLGLCTDLLDIGCRNKPALLGENLYLIGAHSIDNGEYGIIKEQKVNLYTPKEVAEKGALQVAHEVLEKTRGKNIHLSFDVDSIDGAEFKSTGYVMDGGMPYSTVFSLLKTFILSGRLSSFDCVEYNPALDKNSADLKKLLAIFALFKQLCRSNT